MDLISKVKEIQIILEMWRYNLQHSILDASVVDIYSGCSIKK